MRTLRALLAAVATLIVAMFVVPGGDPLTTILVWAVIVSGLFMVPPARRLIIGRGDAERQRH